MWTVSDPKTQPAVAAIIRSNLTECSCFERQQYSHSCLFIFHVTFRNETEDTGNAERVKITLLSLRDESTFVGGDAISLTLLYNNNNNME